MQVYNHTHTASRLTGQDRINTQTRDDIMKRLKGILLFIPLHLFVHLIMSLSTLAALSSFANTPVDA